MNENEVTQHLEKVMSSHCYELNIEMDKGPLGVMATILSNVWHNKYKCVSLTQINPVKYWLDLSYGIGK